MDYWFRTMQKRNSDGDDDFANYNRKEIIVLLRGIDELLRKNNDLLQANNLLMKNIVDNVKSIAFNTKD